ncbi:hypothetical protein CSOJ01_03394 [Colletotrichum sojae]|uniref:Aminoglycoside phosphotransferase domain-containing protein n=1 Tax=Colletotrichum sojae TaxID=2175907 RepID=A0A8H6JM28_9PEZI|nr:hypothetical protein CSOJ01_03394 [Colletotrichum sojae]
MAAHPAHDAVDPNADKIGAFLARNGLRPSALPLMHAFARQRFPGREVVAAPFQGYCSYTLILLGADGRRDSGCDVDEDGGEKGRLVQFRPRRHGIDVKVCEEARAVLGAGVVPLVEDLGILGGLETDGSCEGEMCGYVVERVGGVSLTDYRAGGGTSEGRRKVVRDLAGVFAKSWEGRRDAASVVRGKIGGSLRWRLEMMLQGLSAEFRPVVRRILREMGQIEGSSWVITHGDLVPDNIMVDEAGGLVGLIDWAEAEWLPFGVGTYGLEEVLGEDVSVDDKLSGTSRFEYYPEAAELRALFWDEIRRAIGDEEVVRKAQLAQVLGVLLWRGIAFDDGALGRVVDPEQDWWDVQRLRAWLFHERGLGIVSRREWWWESVWRGLFGWAYWCWK